MLEQRDAFFQVDIGSSKSVLVAAGYLRVSLYFGRVVAPVEGVSHQVQLLLLGTEQSLGHHCTAPLCRYRQLYLSLFHKLKAGSKGRD